MWRLGNEKEKGKKIIFKKMFFKAKSVKMIVERMFFKMFFEEMFCKNPIKVLIQSVCLVPWIRPLACAPWVRKCCQAQVRRLA